MTRQRKNMTIKTITKNIKENIQNSLEQFDIILSKKDLNLSPPKQESFGDLSSNIALILAKQIKRNDRFIQYGENRMAKKEISQNGCEEDKR